MACLSTGCSVKKSSVEHFKRNHENAKCINIQFHNLKFSYRNFGLSCHTATAIRMKGVIKSSLRRAIWMKIMETLILTMIVLNLVSRGLSFYYTVLFTGTCHGISKL